MGLHCLCFLLFTLSSPVFSAPTFPAGYRVSIPIPSVHQPGFVGRAFVLDAGNVPPDFKAALSVEAGEGRYSCSIVVLLGDFKVWASDHLEKFIPAGSCILHLTADGDLQLKDRAGRVGWRSGTPGLGVESLHLKNTGNLVLIDAKNQTKWESFDHPTNTLLWGQRLDESARLTSFPANSSAFYSLDVQQDKIVSYLNWRGNNYSYWEVKPRGARSIAFVRLGSRGLKVFDRKSWKIAQVLVMNPGAVRFLALGSQGNFGLYYYSASQGKFEASFRALEFCDLPLPCGPYGICSRNKTCAYLQLSGVEYSSNFCGVSISEVEMVELQSVVTVLRTSPVINVSKEECLASCLEDCSCAAALFLSGGGGGGGNGTGESCCFRYALVGGAREVETGSTTSQSSYWIKISKSGSVRDESSSLMSKVLIVGGVVDGVALCVILGGLLYYFFKVRKRSVDSGTNGN